MIPVNRAGAETDRLPSRLSTPVREAMRAAGHIAGLALGAVLLLAAASLFAVALVRLGADWLDGIDPFGSSALRPYLNPRRLAWRSLAVDILRQVLLAALVFGVARWCDGTAWRKALLGETPVDRSSRVSAARIGAIVLLWPLVHILWVSGVAEAMRAPLGSRTVLSRDLTVTAAALWLAYVTMLAPMAEELLLRGFLYGRARRALAPAGAIAVTALIFALAHVTPAGLARPLSLLPLGLVLGWLRWRTGRVWPGIVLHGWSNFAMVLYLLVPLP